MSEAGVSGKAGGDKCLLSDPVDVVTGHLYEVVEEFGFSGFWPFLLHRKYGSDFDFVSALGSGFITPLDVFIIDGGYNRHRRREVIYYDANGLAIHFNKPVPVPGGWEFNKKHKSLKLGAGSGRSLILHEGRLERHFKKYADGVWRLMRLCRGGQEIIFERRSDGFLECLRHPGGLSLVFHEAETDCGLRGLRGGYDVVAPSGHRHVLLRYGYDGLGRLVRAINPYGEDRFYFYDEAGHRIGWSDGQVSKGRHEFDGQGRVISVATNGPYDGDRFVYDGERRVSHYLPGGREQERVSYIYGVDNSLDAIRNAVGVEARFEYDGDGQQIARMNGEGEREETSYDIYGYVRSYKDGEGRETYYVHSSEGDLLQIIPPGADGWRFEYDINGVLTQVVAPGGVITELKNNERGQPVGIMRHDGLLEQRVYDDYGRLIESSDYRGGQTLFGYDEFGRLIAIKDAGGGITRFFYDFAKGSDFWQPSRIERADGVSLQRYHDANGQHIRWRDGEGRDVIYHYGAFHLVESIEDAKGGKLSFGYDGQERLSTVTNPLGQVWRFERDGAGRVIRETDFSGQIQEYSHDKADRVVETRFSDGARLCFCYDKSGLLNREHVFGADGLLQDETTYAYDNRGLLIRAENRTARIDYERDGLGRVVKETLNGREIRSSYDCCGNRLSREIGDNSLVEAVYDPLGALTSLTIDGHRPLTLRRDVMGRELYRESAAGFMLEQSFDIIGQLTGQRAGFSIASLGAGLEGAMAAQARGLSPKKLGGQVERRYQWNNSFEPTQIKDKRWGEASYAYDVNGQVTQARFGDGSHERFAYDGALNISAFSETSDVERFEPWLSKAGGMVTRAQGPRSEQVELEFDGRNRVIARKVLRKGFRPKLWRYEWDAKDRLIATTTPEGERWTYHYDPFGRRIFKINAGAARAVQPPDNLVLLAERQQRGAFHLEESSTQRYPKLDGKVIVGTSYLWDGDVLAQEAPLLADGTIAWEQATHWYYEPMSFKPLAKKTADGKLYYIVSDHLGTAREMFSEDGMLVWAVQYRTWGGIKHIWQADNDNLAYSSPNPSPAALMRGSLAICYDTVSEQRTHEAVLDCPIRFAGQWEDAESGLYYNRYRYYDPLTGQYLSPDPIGLAGGLRPNGYVHNPIAWTDPLGLACCMKGAEEATEYLRSMGLTEKKISEIIESFDPSSISVQKAGDNLYALRFYDGKDAHPMGQYLFETFTPQTNRSGLALPPDWNGMTGIKQWQITPGTIIIRGKAAPQLGKGSQYTGGSDQIFVLEPWKHGGLQ